MSDTATRLPDPRLTAIVGHWRTSGHVIGDPQVPVVGTDIYELFAGGHFLVHHVDVTVGGQSVRGDRDRLASPTAKAGTWVVAMTATVTRSHASAH